MADLSQLVSIEDLRQAARRRLPRAIFDFFDGGAEDEVTLRENRAAFERVRLLPKVLVNVAAVDMKVQLLGGPAALPLAIAPTGGINAGRAGAELALARAAKAFGVPFTLARPAARWTRRSTEKRSSASASFGHARCCSKAWSAPRMPSAPRASAATASWYPTTAAGSSTAPLLRWKPCPQWLAQSVPS